MKKKKFNFTFILIILLGLIVSSAVFLVLNLDKEEVLVSVSDIEPMTVLTGEMMTTKYVDKNYMIEGYIPYSEVESIIGKTVKYGIPTGNFVVMGSLYSDNEYEQLRMDEANILHYMLPVDAKSAFGGDLAASDRINITIGYKTSLKVEDGLDTSKKVITILQNIEIVEPVIIDDVLAGLTLKVNQEQLNKLTYAMQYASKIYLSKVSENYQPVDNIEENEETFLTEGHSTKDSGIIINVPTNQEQDIKEPKPENKKEEPTENENKTSDAKSEE